MITNKTGTENHSSPSFPLPAYWEEPVLHIRISIGQELTNVLTSLLLFGEQVMLTFVKCLTNHFSKQLFSWKAWIYSQPQPRVHLRRSGICFICYSSCKVFQIDIQVALKRLQGDEELERCDILTFIHSFLAKLFILKLPVFHHSQARDCLQKSTVKWTCYCFCYRYCLLHLGTIKNFICTNTPVLV